MGRRGKLTATGPDPAHPPLHPCERDCLTRIARGEASSRACTEGVLRRLLSLGLIESSPTCCLPIEMPARDLRLTPAGRTALDPD